MAHLFCKGICFCLVWWIIILVTVVQKSVFCLVTSMGQRKVIWVSIRKGTTNLQIFHSFPLPLSHRDSTVTLAIPRPGSYVTHLLHSVKSKMLKTLCEWLFYLSICSKQVNSLAVSMDGTLLLSGSQDQTARVWHIPSRQCLRVVNHKGKLNHFTLRSD